jgi:hypothetical protein
VEVEMRRRVISVALIVLMLTATVGVARAEEDLSYGRQAGWGFAAVGTNLFYIPAKVAYVVVACVTGGLVYGLTLGNSRAVDAIFSPALGGTYVVTPAMMRGEEPIFFFGESIPD